MKYSGITKKTKKKLKPKMLLLLLPIIVITGILIFFANSKLNEDQSIQHSEASSVPDGVTLSIKRKTGNDNTFQLATRADININIDTSDKKVTAAEIILPYNQNELEIKSISFGQDLPVVLSKATYTNGQIKFTVGAPVSSGGKKGKFTLATISVLPKKVVASSSINFNAQTQVAAIGSTTSVIKEMTGLSYKIIKGNDGTPTPTIKPSTTPEPKLECGNFDSDNNKKVDMFDFTDFVKIYTKKCIQKESKSSCGARDSNGDGSITIKDFVAFVKTYDKECSTL